MLEGLFILLILSVVMITASFLAGALPLSMTLTPSQLRLISSIGMGVLVGTSLIVIIPEGIGALYAPEAAGHSHGLRSVPLQDRSLVSSWAGRRSAIIQDTGHPLDRRAGTDSPGLNILEKHDTTTSKEEKDSKYPTDKASDKPPSTKPGSNEEDEHHEEPTVYIGLSLISGFILMFLIDKLPRHASENLQPPPATRHISLNNLSQGLHSSPNLSHDEESDGFLQSLTPSPKQTRSLATTTGLVIHAAADGIAMGASATSSDSKLGFIVFVAIMVHKAPAAFGLTSVLLKQGLSKRAARGHLIIFSLAAPFGALSTWLLVNLLGGWDTTREQNRMWWTGMLLLFSGGTFLYVAMHAMQDESASHDHPSSNGYAEGGSTATRKQPKPQMRDTLAAVGGMLVPLLTQFGHAH